VALSKGGDSTDPAPAENQQGQVIYLIRHGEAGSRQSWSGPDQVRPLTSRGIEQATLLAGTLRRRPIIAVISSPYLRCVETVQPLATRLGLGIEEVSILGPDEPSAAVGYLRRLERPGEVAVCTHGEVIAHLLLELNQRDGLDTASGGCRKGSYWTLLRVGSQFVEAAYYP
jgi:broad specificity phosphatase PhoE